MFRIIPLAPLALLFLVAAAPVADPPAAFGARESVLDIALSPSGRKLAFIGPGPGQATKLYTVDVAAGGVPRQALGADGKPERLAGCGWVSEERLVCTVYMVVDNILPGQPVGATRLIAINADGSGLKLLSRRPRPDDRYISFGGGDIIDWLPASDGAVLMGREYVPEARMGTNLQDKRQGYGVDRIDTSSLSSKSVEPPRANAVDYISDGRGSIRIMAINDIAGATGYDSGRINYQYRAKASRDWKPLGTFNRVTGEGFRPVAVDPDLDLAYGFKGADGGRWALYSVALDGSNRETLVFAHPQVDVDSTVRIGRAHRVVGATYATEKREAVYFDAPLAALGRSLSKALPGLPLIRFVDSSADESQLLLWAGSDTDPGRYYLFDKASKRLNELMLARPQLESASLATMKSVRYKASDGTEVPAYLTLPPGSSGKNLPAIVMPHGGPSARDEWGFDWLAQFFASRGFAVLQPNYRGSAGYGDAWYRKNGFQSWRSAVGDVNDAGRWLARMFTNHRTVRTFIGTGPHLREGSPAQNAAKIKAPVLLFHGTLDLNVGVRQSRMMQDRLKDAGARSELVVYDRLDHQLDDSEARTDMLRRTDAFLRSTLKLK